MERSKMFYASNKVESILRCDFCKQKFTDVVKVIQDCSSSICGKCNDDLRDSMKMADQFLCKLCKVMHKMPANGLADVKAIMKMLQIKPEVKALSDECLVIKRRIGELQNRIERLKHFDIKAEVNSYCDLLQKEVKDSIESSVKLLNKIGEGFSKEIEEYRESLLEPRSPKSLPAKRPRTVPPQDTSSPDTQIKRELEALTKEMDDFNRHWFEYFTQINKVPSQRDVDRGKETIAEMNLKAKQVENKLISSAFNGRFLRLRDQHLFMRNKKIFGRLCFENTLEGNLVKEELVQTIQAHNEAVRRVLFLDNGRMATCSRDNLIKIWNPASGELVCELAGHSNWVIALAQLPNHWLVSASRDSNIKIWDLHEKKGVRTLSGHNNSVFSLKVLPNGMLASASFDDTIKVWDPYVPDKPLLQTMKGHGVQSFTLDLHVLPNGHLVTCSNEAEADNMIRVWNAHTGQLVTAINTHAKSARSLFALPDGRVVVGFADCDLKIIEIDADIEPRRFVIKHDSDVWSLNYLPCGYVVGAGFTKDRQLKVWNPISGQLLQTITTGHTDGVFSIAVSEDGKFLATGSQDKTVKIWSITC